MTTELAQMDTPLKAEEAARMVASWPDFLRTSIQSQKQASQIAADIPLLKIPATRQWIAGRIVTLLSHGFVSSTPAEIMGGLSGDWQAELDGYPEWALQKACRWWVGIDNPDRRKRPVPGDISAKANHEMSVVRYAQRAVHKFSASEAGEVATPRRTEPSQASRDRVADIVRKAGYSARASV